MKQIFLLLLLAMLCGLTGCHAPEAPLITVTSGDTTVTPYVKQVSKTEGTMLLYDGDLRLSLREGMELRYMEVYKDGERLPHCMEPADLEMLEHGMYELELRIQNTEDETEEYACRVPLRVIKPLVTVTSGGVTVEAYDHWENGFDGEVCADGPPLYAVLPEIEGQIPVLHYDADFAYSVRKGVTLRGMYVSASLDDLYNNPMNPEELSELEAGTYYVCFPYVEYGMEIEEDLCTYDGGTCVVKLVIPE